MKIENWSHWEKDSEDPLTVVEISADAKLKDIISISPHTSMSSSETQDTKPLINL